ncbi:Uncharacterized protein GBIM_08895 [Gryllus bimaculatus]|nr:Uncharacterized protein GBIM_08895 [Gryllus bimaculatus]
MAGHRVYAGVFGCSRRRTVRLGFAVGGCVAVAERAAGENTPPTSPGTSCHHASTFLSLPLSLFLSRARLSAPLRDGSGGGECGRYQERRAELFMPRNRRSISRSRRFLGPGRVAEDSCFYALPAKELNLMFPNESSSHDISKTYAFKVNFNDANVDTNDVPERVAEPPLAGFAHSNEAVRRPASAPPAPRKPAFPTNQVPVLRDTSSRPHAEKPVSTWVCPRLEPVAASLAAMTIPAGGRGALTGSGFPNSTTTGLGPSEDKAEAMSQQQQQQQQEEGCGGDWVGAGAGPSTMSLPVAASAVAASVISSSAPPRHGTVAEPPSFATSLGAQQGFNAMLASHLGSSNSNSLSRRDAQSHHSDVSFTDVDPTHVSQAIENPNKSSNQVQEETSMQSCVNFRSEVAKAEEEEVTTCSGSVPPGQEGGIPQTTGALSDQDKLKFKAKIMGKTVSLPIAAQGETLAATNIPSPCDSALVNLHATVQGISDSNPPPSFNNLNVNAKNNVTLTSVGEASVGPASNARWGIPRGLGLRGGGESSSSWGTPPSGGSTAGSGWGGSGGGGQTGGSSSGGSQGQWGGGSNSGNQSSGGNNMNRGSGGGQGQGSGGQNGSGKRK